MTTIHGDAMTMMAVTTMMAGIRNQVVGGGDEKNTYIAKEWPVYFKKRITNNYLKACN